jgi:hypothetical protein
VNLGGTAARASPRRLGLMAAQLFTTLTSTSYSSPAIARHLELKINGQARPDLLNPAPYLGVLPGSPAGTAALYYLAQNGTVSELGASASRAIRNPPGHDQVQFAQIAVAESPTGTQQLAGTVATSGRGCGIYHGPLASSAELTLSGLPAGSGPCTSVSWDSQGDIWAVTADGIWMLPESGPKFVSVGLPMLPGGSTAPYTVTAIRVAPDAVRVAMLVQVQPGAGSPGAPQVVMAAVSHIGTGYQLGPTTVSVGPTLTDPAALSWLDPDHLVVLARSQLYSVPVNGGALIPIDPAPPGASLVSAAGPGHIAVGGGGDIWTTTGPDQPWAPSVKGTSAAYSQ